MAEAIFWVSLLLILYVYFGYPALLWVWRHISHRAVRKVAWEPRVSLIVAAYNEGKHIERKIRNCLHLDYPQDRLQIIISLDGPSDDTEAMARKYRDQVEVIHSPFHRGKAAALNAGVRAARGELVVFADARQQLDSQAVRELVANFQDPLVGAVSGELILLDSKGREAADGAGLYWRYEKWLRAMESDIHSLLGATGAIYAIRRELYRELPEDLILDDMAIPLQIVFQGKRSVFDPSARAYDRIGPSEMEYGRKVRTLMGNYQLLAHMPELLLPGRNPVFFQFVSHKLGRLLVPYFLVALFVSNAFLLDGFYLVSFLSQAFWYLLACAGILLEKAGHERQAAAQVPR